jgi:hypothetical protein
LGADPEAFTARPDVCGCDGETYESDQHACHRGVRWTTEGSCGATAAVEDEYTPTSQGGGVVTPCGSSDQCPDGLTCCAITGQCHDPQLPELCAFPPPDTYFPCLADEHCAQVDFCYRSPCDEPGACCSGPGGCVPASGATCPGEQAWVCGCDGKTYLNAGCARAGGTNVDHHGECVSP